MPCKRIVLAMTHNMKRVDKYKEIKTDGYRCFVADKESKK
jgi:hypothetical protein